MVLPSAGDRLKEATKINLSLSALGNVISALVDSKSGAHHRDWASDASLTRQPEPRSHDWGKHDWGGHC